jgi:valyl-tRNA synthetase
MGGQDIHFNEDHIMAGKKFCNKIWNSTRFALGFNPQIKGKLTKIDKQILKEFKKVKKNANKNIEQYKFGHALHGIYDFFWHEFCDVYIEKIKNSPTKENKKILVFILTESLKLLHPFMPFITEEIWSMLPIKGKKLLIIEQWPKT